MLASENLEQVDKSFRAGRTSATFDQNFENGRSHQRKSGHDTGRFDFNWISKLSEAVSKHGTAHLVLNYIEILMRTMNPSRSTSRVCASAFKEAHVF